MYLAFKAAVTYINRRFSNGNHNSGTEDSEMNHVPFYRQLTSEDVSKVGVSVLRCQVWDKGHTADIFAEDIIGWMRKQKGLYLPFKLWCSAHISTFLLWIQQTWKTPQRVLLPLPAYLSGDGGRAGDKAFEAAVGRRDTTGTTVNRPETQRIFCILVVQGRMQFTKGDKISVADEGQCVFCLQEKLPSIQCAENSCILPLMLDPCFGPNVANFTLAETYERCKVLHLNEGGRYELSSTSGKDRKATYMNEFNECITYMELQTDNRLVQFVKQIGGVPRGHINQQLRYPREMEITSQSHVHLVSNMFNEESTLPANMSACVRSKDDMQHQTDGSGNGGTEQVENLVPSPDCEELLHADFSDKESKHIFHNSDIPTLLSSKVTHV